MLSDVDFIKQSLALHLFFARIMKEHSFFLQISFTPRDSGFMQQADAFRMQFDQLLNEAVQLSNGVVDQNVLSSGEVITPYTLRAETTSSFFTSVRIPTGITQAEAGLVGGGNITPNPMLVQRVLDINQRAISLIAGIIRFKTQVLSNVLSCRMFTTNYPLLIDHITREARLYLSMVQRLQNRDTVNINRDAYEQELFWNRIMGEHALFIRGLLDPTENTLITTANNFGNEFIQLVQESQNAIDKTLPISNVTRDSLRATRNIRNFKEQGTKGILDCQIRSIIIPLLGDHTLREASHYLRLLNMFQNIQ